MKTIYEYLVNNHVTNKIHIEQIDYDTLNENDYFVLEINDALYTFNKILCKFKCWNTSGRHIKKFNAYIAVAIGTEYSCVFINANCSCTPNHIFRMPNVEERDVLKTIDDTIISDYEKLGETKIGTYDYKTRELKIDKEYLK